MHDQKLKLQGKEYREFPLLIYSRRFAYFFSVIIVYLHVPIYIIYDHPKRTNKQTWPAHYFDKARNADQVG